MTPESKRSQARYLQRKIERAAERRAGLHKQPDAPGSTGDPAKDGPAKKHKRARGFFTIFREYLRLLRGHRATVAASLGTVTLSAVVGLAAPALTKVSVDYVLTNHPGPEGLPPWLGLPTDRRALLWVISIALVVIAAVSTVVGMWGRWQITRIRKRLEVSLRRRAFDQAVRLPLHRVYQLKSGGVASILREDAGGAAELIFTMIYNPWRAVVQLLGTLVILTITDWRLLLGSAILGPAVWVTHQTWIGRIRPIFKEIRGVRTSIDAHATEVFGGMRVVRGFSREAGEATRFVVQNNYMSRLEILAWWWSRAVDIAWSLLIPIATSALLVYGGMRVIEGTLTIGDLMMFSTYLIMLLAPMETLASTATNIQSNLAGFDRILDLFAEAREFQPSPGAGAGADSGAAGADEGLRPQGPGAISLREVWFQYPSGKEPVIRGVSLDVRPGEVIALVGASGSGKTTLCNLIARFFDPTKGQITLDSADLRRIDVRWFRSMLGIVEQDVFLFDGTIGENIGYARPDASAAEIAAAARAANAEEFIGRLEKRYETVVGERGVRLSGGQKQRIAIARAILADPRILILDEATSNLDSESEALIQASLATLMQGRTCFVIAHRLSTIRHADRIAVLEDGELVELGSHDDLLRTSPDGRYAALLRMQVEGAAKGARRAAAAGAAT